MAKRSKALGPLKVLDLSRVRAGPACCRILADFGADVIRIEAPEGADPSAAVSGARHGYDMLNLHRNKRSLTLNLKDPEGQALFMRMVEGADIIVENFRPDVKDRLGIAYKDLAAANPRIILASISGFGQDGPYAKRAGFDQIAQGMGGLMGVTGKPEDGLERPFLIYLLVCLPPLVFLWRCKKEYNQVRANGCKVHCLRPKYR